MFLFVSLAALAAQPGADAPVVTLDASATVQTGRTGMVAPAVRASVAAPEDWFGTLSFEGIPGLEQGLLDDIETLLEQSGDRRAIEGPSGLIGSRLTTTAGWQHGMATRDAGIRAEAGLSAAWTSDGRANTWVEDNVQLSMIRFEDRLHVGPDAFFGVGLPMGDDLDDPLFTGGLRATWSHPVWAWSFNDGGAGLTAREFLDEVGAGSRAGLMSPRAGVRLQARLNVDRITVHVEPGFEWAFNPPRADRGLTEDVQAELVVRGGVGWVF